MHCWVMCNVMLITLVLTMVTTNHSKHVISRLSCVTSVQRCVAQWRTAMDLSRHTQCCAILFVCVQVARPDNIHSRTKHVYGNYCSIQQCLTGVRVQKTVVAALRIWHALVIHPTLQTRTHMAKHTEWCSVIMQCFIMSMTLASAWNVCITSSCTFGVWEGLCMMGS
jgi:hypothetical protein